MLNKANEPTPSGAHSRVLAVLQGGARTWDEIQAGTKFGDDRLGLVLGELFEQRKVRTAHRGEVRVYWLVQPR